MTGSRYRSINTWKAIASNNKKMIIPAKILLVLRLAGKRGIEQFSDYYKKAMPASHKKVLSLYLHHKAVANPFNSNDFECGICFQVTAEFSDIYIEVTAVEERIISPQQ